MGQLAAKTVEVSVLEDVLSSSQSGEVDARVELERIREVLSTRTSQLDQVTAQVSALEQALVDAQENEEEIMVSVGSMSEALETSRVLQATLGDELSGTKALLAEREVEMTAIRQALAVAQEQAVELQAEKAGVEASRQELLQALARSEERLAETTARLADLENLQVSFFASEAEWSTELEQTRELLNRKVEELTVAEQTMADSAERIDELVTEVTVLEFSNATLHISRSPKWCGSATPCAGS